MAGFREFVEGQSRIEAVVSVPVDTFVASGATVKTSLLFLRKFSELEAANWKRVSEEEENAERARRKPELDAQKSILAIAKPKMAAFAPPSGASKSVAEAAALQFEAALKAHSQSVADAKKKIKEISGEIVELARKSARARCSYPIFYYDAAKVGITSTGEADDNELFPNPRAKAGEPTALELFREHQAAHAQFFKRQWECSKPLQPETDIKDEEVK